MQIMMYTAFYRANPSAFPISFETMVSYVWMQQAFLTLFVFWRLDNSALAAISSGNVACDLVRPINLYSMWYVKNLAMRLSSVFLRCIPLLLIAFFLPAPFRLELPKSGLAFLLCLVTMVLATLLAVGFCMLIYIATFYMLNSNGLRGIIIGLTGIFSGVLIPLPFIPDGVRQVMQVLPLGSMQSLPLLIYSGSCTGKELIRGIAL